MNPMDEQQKRNLQADELDSALDAALAKYAAVEPRTGLEDRILARVRAEALRPARHAWLQWGLAGAFAAIAVIAVFIWRSSQAPQPLIADHPPVRIHVPSAKEVKPTHQYEVGTAKPASVRKPAEHQVPALTATARPKLDQFPSPQPLSAEEIALARYVENYPKEAQLVARTQEEFELETQRVMSEAGNETRPTGSIQQER